MTAQQSAVVFVLAVFAFAYVMHVWDSRRNR